MGAPASGESLINERALSPQRPLEKEKYLSIMHEPKSGQTFHGKPSSRTIVRQLPGALSTRVASPS
jgi:hypothetical protein